MRKIAHLDDFMAAFFAILMVLVFSTIIYLIGGTP
jgi:hypothetical protein